MPAWFSKLKSATRLRRSMQEAPIPLQLMCQCGKMVNGHRMKRYQQVICRDCGEALFVLPKNVYPEPPPNLGFADARSEPAQVRPPADRTNRSVPEAGEPRQANREKRDSPDAATESSAPVQMDVETQTAEQPVLLKSERIRLRSVVSPFRLIVVAVILLVVVTFYWQRRGQGIEDAELAVQSALEAAEAAVADRDFVSAEREYGRALDALELLPDEHDRRRRIRQSWRQSHVVSHLASKPLYEALLGADRSRHVVSRFDDSWLLLDTWITRNRSEGGINQYHVLLPPAGDAAVVLRCTAPQLDRLDFTGLDRRVVFAARVANCAFQDGVRPRWIVDLDRDDFVLWTSLDHYRGAGLLDWRDGDPGAVKAVLAEQDSSLAGAE